MLRTAQMGFLQTERGASLPLELLLLLCLNLNGPQGIKQGQEHSWGAVRAGNVLCRDTRGACLPAGAAGGAVR